MESYAITTHEAPLELLQKPIPAPQKREVLLKVTHCGVCHSDLHLWEGFYDLGNGQRFEFASRGVKLPVAAGHEILGVVAAFGPDVDDEVKAQLKLGDRRVVYPWIGCGKEGCRPCARGHDNMCTAQRSLGIHIDGGFASHVLVRDPKYLVDPGDLDPAVACTFGCSGITVLSAVRKAGPLEVDDTVVLIGAGGLGLSAIQALRATGHRGGIVSVDLDAKKREAALQAGATRVADGGTDDAKDQLLKVCGGPVPAVIDFVNNAKTSRLGYDVLAKGGKLVQVGIMGGSMTLALAPQILRAITIVGNLTGNVEDLKEVVRLAKEGKWKSIPTTEIKSERASEALGLVKDGKVTGRLILVW